MAGNPPPLFPDDGAYIQRLFDTSEEVPYMLYISGGQGYHLSIDKLIAVQMLDMVYNNEFPNYNRSVQLILWRQEITYAIKKTLERIDVRADFLSTRFIKRFIRLYFCPVNIHNRRYVVYIPRFPQQI